MNKLILLAFYTVASIFALWVLYLNGNYGAAADFIAFDRSINLLSVFFLGVLLVYFLVGLFYFAVTRFVTLASKINQPPKLIDLIMVVCLLLNTITVYMGIGKAGGAVSSFGFLQSLLPLVPMTLLYYSMCRRSITWYQILLILVALIIGVVKGWIGHLMLVAILEYLFRTDHLSLRSLLAWGFGFFAFVAVFYFLVPLKFYIRTGVYSPYSLIEFSEYLFGRVSYASILTHLISVKSEFLILLNETKPVFFYITDYLLGFLPKALVGIPEYAALDNIFAVNFINPEFKNSGFSITLPGLFLLSKGTEFFLIAFLIGVFCYQFFMLSSLVSFKLARNLFFLNLMSFTSSGSLKEIALFNYLVTVIFIVLLLASNLPKKSG